MPHPASDAGAAAAEWSEGHALRPKRVADVSSVLRSLDLLLEGPSPHKEIARGEIERFDEPRAGHKDPARGARGAAQNDNVALGRKQLVTGSLVKS